MSNELSKTITKTREFPLGFFQGSSLPTMDVLSRPAEEFDNDQVVEGLWAMRTFEHAEIYYNLIQSVDPRQLKLTPFDDIIYTTFRQDFPTLKIDQINESDLKSAESKDRWRKFIEKFNKMENFGFGTLLRIDSRGEVSEANTILVVRVQFLAIEIARNREGLNDWVFQQLRPVVNQVVDEGVNGDSLTT